MRSLVPVICLLLAACIATPLPPSSTPSVAPEPSARPTRTPVEPRPLIGPFDENGIPTTLEGEPVHRADDLAAAIRTSADATPFLAGGWFHADAPMRYCALFFGDQAVAECPGVSLFQERVDEAPLFLGPGGVPNVWTIGLAATRPVVLHDPYP